MHDLGPRPNLPVAVVCGMDFEAKIANGPGVAIVYGQNRIKLAAALETLIVGGASGIVSFGTAGGLQPGLAPGDVIVAGSVVTATRTYAPDPVWSRYARDAIGRTLSHVMPGDDGVPEVTDFNRRQAGPEMERQFRRDDACHAETGCIYAADTPALTTAAKARIGDATGASAIDMESDIVAEAAARHKLPFIVIRAVLDPFDRAIPGSALNGVRENGKSNPAGVLAALLRRPGEVPAIVRLARDASAARMSLFRSRQRLGPFFGLFDARQLPLDME